MEKGVGEEITSHCSDAQYHQDLDDPPAEFFEVF
jgi:hypothetical protein